MSIRWASVEDAGAIAEVHVASWRAAYRGLFSDSVLEDFTADGWEQHFRTAIAGQADQTAVVEDNGRVVGYTIIGPCRDEDRGAENRGEVWGLYIFPDHWGKGLGTRLTDWGCRELQSRGYDIVSLWVFENNRGARDFYEARGFAADGASRRVRVDAPVAVRYCRGLGAA